MQTVAAQNAVGEAKRQADAATRPYLFAKVIENNCSFSGWTDYAEHGPVPCGVGAFAEKFLDLSVSFTNHGLVPAIIKRVECSIVFGTEDGPDLAEVAKAEAWQDMLPIKDLAEDFIDSKETSAVARCFAWPQNSEQYSFARNYTFSKLWMSGHKVWVSGYIVYTDTDRDNLSAPICAEFDGFRLYNKDQAKCNIPDIQGEEGGTTQPTDGAKP